MDTLSQREVTQGLRLLVPNSKNARPSQTTRTTTTTARTTCTAATTTRTAATTATFPVVPQYSNLANHRAPTTARTAPTAQQTQLLNQARETNSPFVPKKKKNEDPGRSADRADITGCLVSHGGILVALARATSWKSSCHKVALVC